MEYFAGLDISMEETHVCVVDRDGAVVHQGKVPSTPAELEEELAKAQRAAASSSRPAGWLRCCSTR